MIRVHLLKPDGFICNNRFARRGDIIEVDVPTAADLLRRREAFIMAKVRLLGDLFVGSRSCNRGDIVEVTPEVAKRLITAKAVTLLPLRAIGRVVLDGRSFEPGTIFDSPLAFALLVIGEGIAVFEEALPDAPASTRARGSFKRG